LDPLAQEIVSAIRGGDVATVQRLVGAQPDLASARITGRKGGSRTLLHVAADWPGQFPNAPEIVRLLVAAGADLNADNEGDAPETPLHWAASSDDVDVAAVLIELGANLEVPGGSIGTPLDNAVGYGCWHVARLLVQSGARVDKAWHAASLGMLDRLRQLVETDPPPSPDLINQAFWHACSGGQQRAAAYLLEHGADLNFVPEYAEGTTLLQATTAPETRRDTLATWLRERGAK
jgi:ankyrin repeat protein